MYNYLALQESDLDYHDVVPIGDLPAGERLFVEIDGRSIVVFKIADQIFSIGDVCSHDDGPVGEGDLEGYEIACPRHGARFDVRTGQVTQMPAVIDIPAYPVRVTDGVIQIGLPKD
jgi:3-phenylpropionate/trans-cinnamate dioxygenase ferredoxin subunit